MVRHVGVHNYCEALGRRRVPKLRTRLIERSIVGECPSSIEAADCKEIALDSEVIECSNARRGFERHARVGASGVPHLKGGPEGPPLRTNVAFGPREMWRS